MKTVSDVLTAFELAALNAGLARNTRKTYAATIFEFSSMLKAGKIAGPQNYFDYLASVKKLSPATAPMPLQDSKKSSNPSRNSHENHSQESRPQARCKARCKAREISWQYFRE